MGDPDRRAVLVEADGGSRGNPGPAAYGAVLMDAETREVIAERAECIGRATNNVAEYRGLLAGLELVAEHAPGADLEVRMDSKLVVEQMRGRWQVKHPALRATRCRRRPAGAGGHDVHLDSPGAEPARRPHPQRGPRRPGRRRAASGAEAGAQREARPT